MAGRHGHGPQAVASVAGELQVRDSPTRGRPWGAMNHGSQEAGKGSCSLGSSCTEGPDSSASGVGGLEPWGVGPG